MISKDTSLSARLLKIVNSAFYGFPSEIDTISRAVTIVGTRQLSTLALGASVIRVFRESRRSWWTWSRSGNIALPAGSALE